MKTKELIKRALKHPDLYTNAELKYFKLFKKQQKAQKKAEKEKESNHLK
jgi:hypothetical protein